MQCHHHLIFLTFEPTKSVGIGSWNFNPWKKMLVVVCQMFSPQMNVGRSPGIFSYRIAICDSKSRQLRFILISWCKSAIYVKVPQIKLRLKKKATAIHLDKLVQKCDLCKSTPNQVNMLNPTYTWKLHLNLKELRCNSFSEGQFFTSGKIDNSRAGWTACHFQLRRFMD